MNDLRSSPPSFDQDNDYSQSTLASSSVKASLDLSTYPPIFLLPTQLTPEELNAIEDKLNISKATLTFDIAEAKIVLGKVGTKKRAQLELRTRKVWTEEYTPVVAAQAPAPSHAHKRVVANTARRALSRQVSGQKQESADDVVYDSDSSIASDEPSAAALRSSPPIEETHATGGSSTESEGDDPRTRPSNCGLKRKRTVTPESSPPPMIPDPVQYAQEDGVIRVVKLDWLEESIAQGAPKAIEAYTVLLAKQITRPEDLPRRRTSLVAGPKTLALVKQLRAPLISHDSIMQRALGDPSARAPNTASASQSAAPYGERRMNNQNKHSTTYNRFSAIVKSDPKKATQLLQQNTSSYEGDPDSEIPPPPEWIKHRVKYACQRSTPANPPNEPFILQLEKIKLARLLTADEVGVRAYSTSVAALRAYPHPLVAGKEILTIPGCDAKIANLWVEWKNSGQIKAAIDAETDESLKILREFYEIWGVGATTAREFYFDKGWRDRDDIIEYGWGQLSRVQQIGVKYYEEFLEGISRGEVERIAAIVREHAVKVRDEGIEVLVVGGYRRGKELSGDVDIIVSHRDLHATANLVDNIVSSLEKSKHITHTLTLALTTTERQQSTLPFKTTGSSRGSGFDTLDKALVVWQDPVYDGTKHSKNPNPHRRVDIIVSPWRTVGCAVLGWSGGTTFQRDIRRWAKVEKNWKFDSSGIRDRATGEVVRLEGEDGVEGSMIDAEKATFAGLGLEWREASERCTG